MGNIVILFMTIVIILYLYYFIFKNRIFLSRYLTSTGGNEPKVYRIKPYVSFIFILIHFIIGIAVGVFVFKNEIDKGGLIRIFVAINAGLFIVSLLLAIYFMVIIGLKEIIAMSDKMINVILIYSIITVLILYYQIFNNSI